MLLSTNQFLHEGHIYATNSESQNKNYFIIDGIVTIKHSLRSLLAKADHAIDILAEFLGEFYSISFVSCRNCWHQEEFCIRPGLRQWSLFLSCSHCCLSPFCGSPFLIYDSDFSRDTQQWLLLP